MGETTHDREVFMEWQPNLENLALPYGIGRGDGREGEPCIGIYVDYYNL